MVLKINWPPLVVTDKAACRFGLCRRNCLQAFLFVFDFGFFWGGRGMSSHVAGGWSVQCLPWSRSSLLLTQIFCWTPNSPIQLVRLVYPASLFQGSCHHLWSVVITDGLQHLPGIHMGAWDPKSITLVCRLVQQTFLSIDKAARISSSWS